MQVVTDDIDFLRFLGNQESQWIEKPSKYIERVLARLHGNHGLAGDKLPWKKTHDSIGLRPGEITLWAGINGHWKSLMLNQVCAWSIHRSPWLIASMEMPPDATFERMTKQVSGGKPSDEYVREFMTDCDTRLWIYDQTDTVKSDRILGMCHYAATELGVKHIVIDSLMKCGIGADDYNAQKNFVDRLCWCAKSRKVHIHLVAHMRKGSREQDLPDKFDVKGAGELTDLVDNVFIVHRNKGKEARVERGEDVNPEEPDCVLMVAKQRHGEWEGKVKLWLHKESMQLVPSPENRPMWYPRKSENAA